MQEIVVILAVALLVFGPKKMPELARNIGKGLGRIKRAVFEAKAEIDKELSRAEGDLRSRRQDPSGIEKDNEKLRLGDEGKE